MRHGKRFNHLGRKAGHRKSMLANMASSLIEHKRINTTLAKAKALRQFVEPIITKSKEDTTHNRRLAFAKLRQKQAVTELFREVAPKVGERPGGYTRIIKLGNRLGDNADMAMIELVDYNELYTTEKPEKKTRRSRRSRGGSGKPQTAETTKTPASEGKTEETDSAEATAPKAETAEKPEQKAKPGAGAKKEAEPKSEEPPAEATDSTKGAASEEDKKEESKATEGKAETKPAPEAKSDKPTKNKDQI